MASFFIGGKCGGKYFFKIIFIKLFHINKCLLGVDMYKASKSQSGQSGNYAPGVAKVVIGALALGIGEFLGSGSATLFGSDQTTGLDELGLR